jgi:hypothetical protein
MFEDKNWLSSLDSLFLIFSFVGPRLGWFIAVGWHPHVKAVVAISDGAFAMVRIVLLEDPPVYSLIPARYKFSAQHSDRRWLEPPGRNDAYFYSASQNNRQFVRPELWEF